MISEAQKRATAKYDKKNYDTVHFRVKKGQRELIQTYAASQSKSLSRFINELIQKEIGDKFQCLNYSKEDFEEEKNE